MKTVFKAASQGGSILENWTRELVQRPRGRLVGQRPIRVAAQRL